MLTLACAGICSHDTACNTRNTLLCQYLIWESHSGVSLTSCHRHEAHVGAHCLDILQAIAVLGKHGIPASALQFPFSSLACDGTCARRRAASCTRPSCRCCWSSTRSTWPATSLLSSGCATTKPSAKHSKKTPLMLPRCHAPSHWCAQHSLIIHRHFMYLFSTVIMHCYYALLLPEARCACRQAAGKGCHKSLMGAPGPRGSRRSKTQTTVGTVLSSKTAPASWLIVSC